MGSSKVYQDRFETNLLQLFAQQENSEWFSIISDINFLRSILLLNRNKHIGDDLFVFYKFLLPPTLLPPTTLFRRP